MKIFDKAQWHIDSGENAHEVIAKLQEVFSFLKKHEMLSNDGLEMYEFGIDSSISLNELMVTRAGMEFLDIYYDEVINFKAEKISAELEKRYSDCFH